MAKFVKLENGTWINVNQIIQIGSVEYSDSEIGWRIITTEIKPNTLNSNSSSASFEVTKQDVENILKASESDRNGY